MSPPAYTTIIFDLGDVLFTWSASTPTTISPRTLHAMLESPTWHAYDRGEVTEDECYSGLAKQFKYPFEEIKTAFLCARDSLERRGFMVDLIQELKASTPGLKVFAMSNISSPDFKVLRTKASEDDWALFDRVFTSAAAGERKPDRPFYEQVVQETGCQRGRTIFVDDKKENLATAEEVGWTGVIYDKFENVERSLRRLLRQV